jgi:hypothetical protein
MPFTPYHFGPAVICKAAIPAKLSATEFIGTQIAVDCETLWHLLRNQSPLHGVLHTGVCASGIGLGVGVVIHFLGRLLPAAIRSRLGPRTGAEWGWMGVSLGGALGGATHSLLDAMMYRDIRPFWPLMSDNPLLGFLSPETVLLLCISAGIGGAVWLSWQMLSKNAAG